MGERLWLQAVWVGIGGFAGSALRFCVGYGLLRWFPTAAFPWGTLTVNVLGTAAMGYLAGVEELRETLGPSLRLLCITGLLGGFTTFSAFGWETLALVRDQQVPRAAVYVAASLLLGGAGVTAGFWLARVTT